MAGTDIAGLAEIQAFAQTLGMDVSDTVAKARMLMETDPVAVRAGAGQLGTMVAGLGSGHDEVHRAGADVLAGWHGRGATAFDPYHVGLVNHIADTKDVASRLAGHLGDVALVFEQTQRAVVTATGIAATALAMARAQM